MTKRTHLANNLLSHSETMRHREDFAQTGFARFLPVYHTKFLLQHIDIYGDSFLLRAGPRYKFFLDDQRGSKELFLNLLGFDCF